MQPIRPSRANFYTGSPLDRAAHRRAEGEWVAQALRSPLARWAPVWRGQALLDGDRAAFLRGPQAAAAGLLDHPWAFLGLLEGEPLLAVDLSAVAEPHHLLPAGAASFIELRRVAGALPAPEAAMLAHARGMMHWRSRHRFCGHCGAALSPRNAGHVMHCDTCQTEHFPRTDPAVIMLVVRDEHALLAHSARFPNATMYSTLAGFVEPGESLEEAVAREVFEEAGLRVREVAYHSSQPWPFPGSLMAGFYASTHEIDLVLDLDELTDARWFSRAEIRAADAHGFMIPRSDSIACRLIEDWLDAA